jgi:hypothetical protein
VWVFVDYRTVTNNVPSGSWARALISGTPTASVGTPSRETGNDKGFWLQGTSGSTGTYNTTVTVKLSGVPAKFNWCAYATDYPPNVTLDKGTYTFKGTTNFIVNNPAQTITTKTVVKTNLTVNTSTTFTDATGCPGIGSLYCPYTGSDLYMDATHLCQQRTSGAKNWEAYIKDSRDHQIYRITQFSDNSWWFADDLAIADKSVGTCNGKRYYLGNNKPDCPAGWQLPTTSQIINKWNASNADPNYGAPLEAGCYYGVGSPCGINGCDACSGRYDLITGNCVNTLMSPQSDYNCFGWGLGCANHSGIAARARCRR